MAFLFAAQCLQAQRLIRVPIDFVHIQDAISAAQNGDTVLVSPGNYPEDIDFQGKAITVTGNGNLALVQLTGTGAGPTVSFVSHEGRGSVLQNITVEGGGTNTATRQAGVYIDHSSPTIQSTQISGASCHGVYVNTGHPLITGNQISSTRGDNNDLLCGDGNGTAVFLEGAGDLSLAVVERNIITANFTGLSVAGALGGGAGILVRNGPYTLLQKNRITDNGANAPGAQGGGILVVNASALIFENLIANNTAGRYGGGVAVISTNGQGGATELVNNTIADNHVLAPVNAFFGDPAAGNEVYVGGAVNVGFSNNIISTNDVRAAVTCTGETATFPSTFFENNDIYNPSGPTTADVEGGVCTFRTGAQGNLTQNPLFTQPVSGFYELTAQSPAIDAGSNGALQAAGYQLSADISTDLNGAVRIFNATGTAVATVDMGAFEYGAQLSSRLTTFSLASSANPSLAGQVVTFTVQATTGSGPLNRTITLEDGANPFCTVQMVQGTGTCASSSLTAGSHQISALYSTNGNQGGDTTTLTQVVQGLPSQVALQVNPQTGPAFSPLTLNARVTESTGAPTGSVQFVAGGGRSLGSATLAADGSASLTTAVLGAGSYDVTAVYSGDATHLLSASGSVRVLLSPIDTALTITATPEPAYIGQAVTAHVIVQGATPGGAATGYITLLDGMTPVGSYALGSTGALDIPLQLTVGSHTLSASYAGDANYKANTANVHEDVLLFPSMTQLTTAPNPSYPGQVVTLTATVTSPAAISGQVTFFDGSTALGSVLSSGGAAVFTTSSLNPGQHAITASFGGSSTIAPSTSAAIAQTVLAAGFGIGLQPASLTMASGKSGGAQIQLTSLGNFAGPLHLRLGSLPTHATGTLSAAAVSLDAGGSATATLHLDTVDTSAVAQTTHGGSRQVLWALLVLPFLLRRRVRVPYLLLSASLCMLVGVCGCGQIGVPLATVRPGVYAIQVVATDINGVSQNAVLQLTITN